MALVPPVRVGGPEGSTLTDPCRYLREKCDGRIPAVGSERDERRWHRCSGRREAVARRGRRIHAHRADGRRDDPRDPDRDGPADVPRRASEVPGPRRPDRTCGTRSCPRGSSTRTTPRSTPPTTPARARHHRPEHVLRRRQPAATASVDTGPSRARAGPGSGRSASPRPSTQFTAARLSASQTCFVILDGTTGTRYGKTTPPPTATRLGRRPNDRSPRRPQPPAGSRAYLFQGIHGSRRRRSPQAERR